MPPRTPRPLPRRRPHGWRLSAVVGLLCLGFACRAYSEAATPVQPLRPSPSIAIIIDDLGYRQDAGERAIRLPGAVTLAVLPYRQHSQHLVREAIAAGKEVMLHAPMEPRNQVPWEAHGLSSDLSLLELQEALDKMLQAMPQATGVNNHMGSKFTEDADAMQWLMGELKLRKLFFIDSLTTPISLAWQSAQTAGVPCIRRDIFLDNVAERDAVEGQFQKLVELARLRGHALAIGHPHDATLAVLEHYLPKLSSLGVRLVPASALIKQANPNQPATHNEAAVTAPTSRGDKPL